MEIKITNVEQRPLKFSYESGWRNKENRKRIRTHRSILYFHIEKESILQNLSERHNRPYQEYRKVIPEILKQLNIDSEKVTYKWSQKAGCSCPCSPGFIVRGLDETSDIFVTIK